MSITINFAGAETYFDVENHLRAALWKKFTETQKKAALAQARRMLERIIGDGDILEDLEDTGNSTFPRPDYACYEQALWILQNMPMTNADETLAIPEATDPETEDRARKAQECVIAPEAIRWLVRGGSFILSRG